MSGSIKEIIKIIENFGYDIKPLKKAENVADELLGRFEGAIPEGKTSTALLKELRARGYGKY
jgi:hypothetical protein